MLDEPCGLGFDATLLESGGVEIAVGGRRLVSEDAIRFGDTLMIPFDDGRD